MRQDVWIAFTHVRPRFQKSVLSLGAKGAYANVLALAGDSREFEEKVRKSVEDYGLELVEFEDAETLDERSATREVSRELLALAETIESSDNIYFDAFCNYFSDDEVQ